MKKFCLAATVAFLGLGVFFLWRGIVKEPIFADRIFEFSATDASIDWLTYTNDQYGFHIKYPPDGWNINQGDSLISFREESTGLQLSIWWKPGEPDVEFARLQKELMGRGKTGVVKISGFDVKRLHSISGYPNCGSNGYDNLFFPGSSGSYEVCVVTGGEKHEATLNETALLVPVIQEMLGTFGTNEIKRSGYLTHSNSRYHFSFTYPADWNLNFDAEGASLRSFKPGTNYWLTFNVQPKTTLSAHVERFGGFAPIIKEKREHFAHKILGHKYTDKSKEGFFFEKNGDLYGITIFRIEGPRKPVDDILDSLEL